MLSVTVSLAGLIGVSLGLIHMLSAVSFN